MHTANKEGLFYAGSQHSVIANKQPTSSELWFSTHIDAWMAAGTVVLSSPYSCARHIFTVTCDSQLEGTNLSLPSQYGDSTLLICVYCQLSMAPIYQRSIQINCQPEPLYSNVAGSYVFVSAWTRTTAARILLLSLFLLLFLLFLNNLLHIRHRLDVLHLIVANVHKGIVERVALGPTSFLHRCWLTLLCSCDIHLCSS
jgi:hypothetical protein